MNASAAATTWEARPVQDHPASPGAVRWGVVHRPTGRWVAFGSEARCRALAAHLTEADAILSRRAPTAGGLPGGDSRPPGGGPGAGEGGMRDGLRERGAALVFRAALWLGVVLTAALVGVLLTPAGADAEAAAAYHPLLWVLRVWTALAWAVVVVGLRGRRRR